MITLNGVDYYSPKEIVKEKLIVNRKGVGDYGFTLRLIKQGKIKAEVFNEDSKIPYYMVSKDEVDKYNNRFSVAK